jgi:RNA polymerase sigma-70 factor, ECF subfamily
MQNLITSDDEQDRQWLAALAAKPNAPAPLHGLFQRYRMPLLRFCAASGLSAADAEEVVQDTFIKMLRHADGFRGEAKVSTWLHQIARNLCIDRLRQNRPELLLDEDAWAVVETNCASDPAVGEFAEHGARHSLQECFDLAFARFQAEHPAAAQALSSVVHLGWGIKELAQALGRTDGATREYLSQCRKKIKSFVAPCYELLKEAA